MPVSDTVLIIPDIHQKHTIVRKLLASVPHTRRIFLGDWFDAWVSRPEDVRGTLDLLVQQCSDPAATLLWGNHDRSYATNGRLACPGYQQETQAAVDVAVASGRLDWNRFRWAVRLQPDSGLGQPPTLVSHAGFCPRTRALINAALDIDNAKEELRALDAAGRARGGLAKAGGPTWLDWNYEFDPVPGFLQIVGHTEHAVPVSVQGDDGFNWCLDTNLKHYGLWSAGVGLTVHEVGKEDLKP